MAHLPSTAILAISMISFAGLIVFASMKHYNTIPRKNNDPGAWELVGYIMGFVCALIGIIIHTSNLDTEPSARSFGMAFLGANLGVAYIYFAIEPGKWQEWSPLVLAMLVLGLLVGVTSFEGDPQAEIKKNASWDDAVVKKFAAQPSHVKARWEREILEEEKLKAQADDAKKK